MRVTQFTQYNNFILNQQNTLNELNKVQTEIATGTKIQNMYDNPTIFIKDLQFKEEINSFKQIKSSASTAKTFANETDTTLNDIVSTLGTFKVNLLKAANDTNNETSREAIVNELKGELAHLKDLANTSIDGKYLFSGSMFNTKPINDEYEYQGNDQHVKAYLGSNVEREYNITGSELFLGKDNDYKKHMSVNIPQFDKMKQHPEFVVRGADGKLYIDKNNPKADAPNAVAKNEPITAESEIRRLTGVEDIDNGDGTYSDGTSYFYIKGKKSDGTTINEKFSLSNSDKVSDLLKKIGEIYGNTATTKAVDVSVNKMGEIEIKDLNSGKMISDFSLVASDKNESSVNDLVKNGDYIVEFQKSYYPSTPELSDIKTNNKDFDNRIFKFGAYFYNYKQKRTALPQDKVFDVLGNINNIDHLKFTGTKTDGSSVNVNLNIDSSTTMQDIIDKIKNSFGNVNVKLENGEIIVTDNTIKKTENSNLSINIEAQDLGNNKIIYFTPKDSVNFDHLWMDKKDNLIKGNYSNIIKDYKTTIVDGEKIIDKNPNAQAYVTEDTTIMDSLGSDTTPQTLNVKYRDIDGNYKSATITLDNNGSTFSVDGNTYHIFGNNGQISPANDIITTTTEIDPQTCKACSKKELNKGVTFRQLTDIVSMLSTNNLPSNDNYNDYKQAFQNAIKDVENVYDYANYNSKDPRNSGIQGAIEAIDHITDHVRRTHSKIGAVSNEFEMTIERTAMLTLIVKDLQFQNIDTDIGEAIMRLNSLSTSYQALLASIVKVNNLTLVKYLR